MKRLSTPFTKKWHDLKAGDQILLTGVLYTREMLHISV